jgi:hypothetical protein
MPLICKILFLPFCPVIVVILEILMLNVLAKIFTHILFATPLTGGDVRRIFNESLCQPQIMFFEDRG